MSNTLTPILLPLKRNNPLFPLSLEFFTIVPKPHRITIVIMVFHYVTLPYKPLLFISQPTPRYELELFRLFFDRKKLGVE